MDGQDHKKPFTPAVHEVHGVHLCHRCGWPFPNPHPSAKHRRAHKRVCGTVEGYRMSQSDLAISDDDDEDEQHTPSPKVEKSNVKESNSGGGVHLRSNKSEDDVFSDAATEFSENGISPNLEEHLKVIEGDDKKIEQKSVEGDIIVSLLNKVDEFAEISEKVDGPTSSDQMCTGAKAVSVEPSEHLQSDDTKYESPKSVPIQVEGDKLASVIEEKASDPSLMAVERKQEPHDKLDGSTRVSDTSATFTAVEDKPKMEDVEVPLAGKSDTSLPSQTSGDVGSSEENCSDTTISIPVFHNSSVLEDDSTTRIPEQNMNHHDGNESGEGAAMEEQLILNSSKPYVNSTDPLTSGEVDVDPRQLDSLPKTGSGLLEFKDVDFMRSRKRFEAGNITGLDVGLNVIPDFVGVKPVGVAEVVEEPNRDSDVGCSEKIEEQPILKDSTNPFSESLALAENYTNNSLINDVQKSSESSDVVHEDTEQKCDTGSVVLPEDSNSSQLKVQETSPVKDKCLLETDSDKSHATKGFRMPVSVGIVETPGKILLEDYSNADKKVCDGEKPTVVNSKSLHDEGYTNDKLLNEKDSVSAADSLEGKWGSISAVETNSQSSPRSETNMQNSELRNIKGHQSKSDDFEPPSFMTLVQPGKTPDPVAAPTASEIEPAQYNQQQNSELQAGCFPSLTNVVNDSQGRKKNEELIAKVTNWNTSKEHHVQLKNLLNEAKSPITNQQKDETFQKDNGSAGMTVSSVVEREEPKLEMPHKEDWNSPARYPTVIKKEKKKGKPYWVPFVCCSSVNRDL